MACLPRRRQVLYGIIFVHLVATGGILLALQGWKSRLVNFDLVPHIMSAHDFLRHGQLPEKGCLSSFASYIPPGITWFFLPGVAIFDDPRVFEYVGSGLLYIGTLLGIFLLAYRCLGLSCALWSTGLYGLSELGLYVAGSLWPRGHPFFYVWMVYWTWCWIRYRQATYVMAALVTWAAGMYVFLELAPALFLFPVMWLLYRAPVKLWVLGVGLGLILLLWYPYLAFESTHGFANLRSQVLQQDLLPVNYHQTWCNPTLAMQGGQEVSAGPDTANASLSLGSRLLVRSQAVIWGALYNFERVARLPDLIEGAFHSPAGIVLLFLGVSSLVWLSMSTASTAMLWRFWRPWLWLPVLVMSLCSVLAYEVALAHFQRSEGTLSLATIESLRLWHIILGLSGVVFWLPIAARMTLQKQQPPTQPRVLVLSLLIPCVLLLGLAEPNAFPLGGERRFWWLWPLEVMLLAAFVMHVLPQLGWPRWIARALQAGLLVIVLGNPLTLSRVQAWWQTGWSGPDAIEIQVIDYIAEQLHKQGQRQTAIGYQTLYWNFPAANFFMATFNMVDSRYKVGADFDLFFTARHGIVNTNQCAEGISPADEYRIVQSSPVWTMPPAAIFALENGWQVRRRFGPYEVRQRH